MQHSFFDSIDVGPEEAEASVSDYRVERNLARAAEYFVAYDICRRGFDCFTVGEGLRYDLIADVGGVRRIQVKSNRRAVHRGAGSISKSYTFGSKQDLREYVGDADLLAFVGMDCLTVLYAVPNQIRRANLHVGASMMTAEASDLSWAEVARTWGLP